MMDNRCDVCTMPNGRHDTKVYRCPRCGIVKWITEGTQEVIRIGGMIIGIVTVCEGRDHG